MEKSKAIHNIFMNENPIQKGEKIERGIQSSTWDAKVQTFCGCSMHHLVLLGVDSAGSEQSRQKTQNYWNISDKIRKISINGSNGSTEQISKNHEELRL